MKFWKRVLSVLLALCVLLPLWAAAEEEEEDYSLTDEGLAEEETFDPDEFIIDDEGEAEAEIDLDSLERDPDVNPDDLEINPNLPDNVINILLIGIDMREKELDAAASLLHNDVTMICSVNTETGEIKLTSLLRDLYVSIPGYKSKGRLNEAYARGSGKNAENGENKGAELTMRTINHLFEMNISQYVVINFYGLASIIESIGGIDVDLTKGEANAINEYIRQKGRRMTYDEKGSANHEKLEVKTGVQHLDGIQAVMYARLRTGMKTGNGDFARTQRQRHLLELLARQVLQDIDLNKVTTLIRTAYPYVKTNISAGTMLQLAAGVLRGDILNRMSSGEEILGQHRVPMDKQYSYDKNASGGSVITMSETNWKNAIQSIHYFIYDNYYPAK